MKSFVRPLSQCCALPAPLSGEPNFPCLFVMENPLKMFHRNVFKTPIQQTAHRAERSCSLRPRKAVAFLTHLLRAPEHGAGNFAVCGQRLRGHVPSKNTSPTVLSWISLTSPAISNLSVPARCDLCCTPPVYHLQYTKRDMDRTMSLCFSHYDIAPLLNPLWFPLWNPPPDRGEHPAHWGR